MHGACTWCWVFASRRACVPTCLRNGLPLARGRQLAYHALQHLVARHERVQLSVRLRLQQRGVLVRRAALRWRRGAPQLHAARDSPQPACNNEQGEAARALAKSTYRGALCCWRQHSKCLSAMGVSVLRGYLSHPQLHGDGARTISALPPAARRQLGTQALRRPRTGASRDPMACKPSSNTTMTARDYRIQVSSFIDSDGLLAAALNGGLHFFHHYSNRR